MKINGRWAARQFLLLVNHCNREILLGKHCKNPWQSRGNWNPRDLWDKNIRKCCLRNNPQDLLIVNGRKPQNDWTNGYYKCFLCFKKEHELNTYNANGNCFISCHPPFAQHLGQKSNLLLPISWNAIWHQWHNRVYFWFPWRLPRLEVPWKQSP